MPRTEADARDVDARHGADGPPPRGRPARSLTATQRDLVIASLVRCPARQAGRKTTRG
jgi:hypothetical protein